MLNREQSEKLVIRLKTAIGCTFNYLADDKKGDIIGLAWLNVMDYSVANTIEYYKSRLKKEQAELLTASIAHQKELLTSIARSERAIVNPDPVPCTEYLKTIIRGILCDSANGLFGNRKQRIIEREVRVYSKIHSDLNVLDSEESHFTHNFVEVNYDDYQKESRYIRNFAEVNYDDCQTETGWEPSTPFIFPECLQDDEDTIEEEKALERERKLAVTKSNPHFAGLVTLAVEHFEAGGTMQGLGEKLGTSGQTVKNRLQAAVKIANDPFRKPLTRTEIKRFSVTAYTVKQANAGRMSMSQAFDVYGKCGKRKRKPFSDPRQPTLL